jgi:hypothetical protein
MMKKGMAIRGKESIPENMSVGMIRRDSRPVIRRNANAARPKQKATGTPKKMVKKKAIKR